MGDQFILKIEGALDADGARQIARELRSLTAAGAGEIMLDCSHLSYALPEGVMELARLCSDLDSESDLRVSAVEISSATLPVFSMFGPPPSNRSVLLRQVIAFVCPACQATLRAPQSGDYACPSCQRQVRLHDDLRAELIHD